MELHNSSNLQASYAGALFKNGQNGLVIVAKGSWPITCDAGKKRRLLSESESLPLQETDTFTGEPGVSSPVFENDFATIKPCCDVIMHANAHAPDGKPVREVKVGMELNNIAKFFMVNGPCQWTKLSGLTQPDAFVTQPINYEVAFGGSDLFLQDKGKIQVCMENPIGRGYMPNHPLKEIEGKPGPQTHQLGQPIWDPCGSYQPQSFGPIARNWAPRYRFGGTYDQHWIENIRPFLPDDFDEQYYQCAPPDQQTKHLCGGEQVTLYGVSPHGPLQFEIPEHTVYMAVIDQDRKEHILEPKADTLIIEPALNRFSIVWRASWPIYRSPEEVDTILVGTPTRAWRHARMVGKTYLPDKGTRM